MKFAALALALLLAVGSQAASLQADAPSQLAHLRAAADVYLGKTEESAKRILDQVIDTEHPELKELWVQHVENAGAKIKSFRESYSPVTDSIVQTITDATAEVRAAIQADIDALETEVAPMQENLRNVINKHIEEYRKAVTERAAEMENLQAKITANAEESSVALTPIVEDLRAKIAANVEETKAALAPIVEAVRSKFGERVANVKEVVRPQVDEYKDQLKQAFAQAQNINTDELPALREKITPLVEDIKVKLQEIVMIIVSTFNKQ